VCVCVGLSLISISQLTKQEHSYSRTMDPAAVSAAVPTTLPFDIPEELLGSHLFLEPDSPEALRLQRKAETLYNLSCLLDPYRSMVLFLEQALLWQRIYSFMALLLLAHAMVTFIGRGIAWLGLLPFVCVAAAGYHVLGALLVCFKLDRAWFMVCIQRRASLASRQAPTHTSTRAHAESVPSHRYQRACGSDATARSRLYHNTSETSDASDRRYDASLLVRRVDRVVLGGLAWVRRYCVGRRTLP